MVKCFLCENLIDVWTFFGSKSVKEESKPICFQCLKRLIDTDGKNVGLKSRIENWLTEQKYSLTQINESAYFFHFILKGIGPFKIMIDIFQKKEDSNLTVGFMIFLTKKLSNKISKFSPEQKEAFKRKVDDFLSTIRVDPRVGHTVGHEIISENGNYGAKYFVKTKTKDCTREKFFKILELVESTSKKSGEFLNRELDSRIK